MNGREDQTIAELGEDALVRILTAGLAQGPAVHIGPGDDCAVLGQKGDAKLRLFKTDCVLESVHYTSQTPPQAVGWKALARAVSDIAAMGGQPEAALVTLALPAWRTVEYARALYAGLQHCAETFCLSIAGGETTRSTGPEGWLSVSLTGWVEEENLITRAGGSAGDALFVTGKLGGSLPSGRHLSFMPRLEQARWLAGNFCPRAMMDLSDGLAKDLPRLAAMSRCGFRLDRAKVPRHAGVSMQQALEDGEDYELLFAIPAASAQDLAAKWDSRFPDLDLTQIGVLTVWHEGESLSGGWDPFVKETDAA